MSAICRAAWTVFSGDRVYQATVNYGSACTYDQAEQLVAAYLHDPECPLWPEVDGIRARVDLVGTWAAVNRVTSPRPSSIVECAEIQGFGRPYLGPHLVKVPRTGVRGDGPGLISNEKTWKPVDQATSPDVLDWDTMRAPDVAQCPPWPEIDPGKDPKPQPLPGLVCSACGEHVQVHALARHAQLAHGVDGEFLLRTGKGGGLWTLAAYYGQASPEVGQ